MRSNFTRAVFDMFTCCEFDNRDIWRNVSL
jgi:hypothetical protein